MKICRISCVILTIFIVIFSSTPVYGRPMTEYYRSIFKITAYDLSVNSCGKKSNHPEYGITFSGYSIAGKSRSEARCCAVDPKVIPIGSRIMVTFFGSAYTKYNGVYLALDIGGGVKGKHIDIFLGDFNSTKESKEVTNFGVAYAEIRILQWGWLKSNTMIKKQ